jgi:hypothetical protein
MSASRQVMQQASWIVLGFALCAGAASPSFASKRYPTTKQYVTHDGQVATVDAPLNLQATRKLHEAHRDHLPALIVLPQTPHPSYEHRPATMSKTTRHEPKGDKRIEPHFEPETDSDPLIDVSGRNRVYTGKSVRFDHKPIFNNLQCCEVEHPNYGENVESEQSYEGHESGESLDLPNE